MTYCHAYETYEFSVFTEAELVDGNLGCGSTFTMPTNSTTCISVTDNDRYLSGDSWCNENANDWRGQYASIEQNGEEVGNGRQIYAECYYWVCDENGNWYVLLEIEQEGTGDDFFAFYTGYGYELPPEGAELTVYGGGNVTSNWVDFNCLDAGDKAPEVGSVSGRYFCDDNDDALDNGEPGIEGKTVTLLESDGVTVVDTTTTDQNGEYTFETVVAGDYIVMFEDSVAEDKFFVAADAGDDEIDSDVVDAAGGKTATISVAAGEDVANVDAGVVFVDPEKSSIFGRYWLDENDNGIDDRGPAGGDIEAGVGGQTITLFAADQTTVLATKTTDSNGDYFFLGLSSGDYFVQFEGPDAGFEFVEQDAVVDGINNDAIDSDVDPDTGLSPMVFVEVRELLSQVDAGIRSIEDDMMG